MFKFVAYLAAYAVYPLSFLFPRNKKKWAFGSFRGAFNDNAKYLFIYCSEHYPEVDCIWLSKSRSTVRDIRALGLKAHFIASTAGILHALTSKYWFYNSYTSDIMFALSGGAVSVNLWHGVGLKRIEFNITSGTLARRYQQREFFEVFYHPESFKRPNWVLTSTPFQTDMFAPAFRIPKNRCLELGYPRNLVLTCSEADRQSFIAKYETESTRRLVNKITTSGYSKVFIYMPTWRDSQREVLTQSFDMPKLNSLLVEQNALLLLKPHANVIVDKAEFDKLSNVAFIDGKTDVYPVMPYTDVLITDYSSVLYDYILMEPRKDVILYLYDYADYVKDRDLFYPFDENVVGRKVYSFDELYHCIENGDYTIDASERQRIIDKLWGETATQIPSGRIAEMTLNGQLA
ncbi:MAG: CDP-glycerol glycerophosphotransferase family protein [Bacteroidales bacterium]|nr:CDP-glycerol glycerophosphotransferase family protein [Bacteroidales bacterium]